MRKKIVTTLGILLIFCICLITLYDNNKKENNLTKVSVADATLTSMFYTTSFNQCIIELKQTKSMNLEKQPVLI